MICRTALFSMTLNDPYPRFYKTGGRGILHKCKMVPGHLKHCPVLYINTTLCSIPTPPLILWCKRAQTTKFYLFYYYNY